MVLRTLFLRVSKPVFAKTRQRIPLRNFIAFLAKKQAPIHVSAVFQVSPGCRSPGKPSWMFQTSPLSRSGHIRPFFSLRRACRCSNSPHTSLLRHQQPCGLVACSAMAVLQMFVVFFFDLGPGKAVGKLDPGLDLLNPERDSWSSNKSFIRYCEWYFMSHLRVLTHKSKHFI